MEEEEDSRGLAATGRETIGRDIEYTQREMQGTVKPSI